MTRATRPTTVAALALLTVLALLAPSAVAEAAPHSCAHASCFVLESTIAFSSTRAGGTAEIYLVNPDGSNVRRLTENTAPDGFAVLSPNGKQIVFDSARLSGAVNNTDLFRMNPDGTEQEFLTHGSSATWAPDGKYVAFHRSASGSGVPIRMDPGSASSDSDLFVANVDDLAAGVAQPTNITNTPDTIEDDADWSVTDSIVFTAHDADDPNHGNPLSAEIYVLAAGVTTRLTFNSEEERAPAWSPDGSRILFMCRRGGPDFELCVMDADGSNQVQLTDNATPDLTATWSPDGDAIVFHGPVSINNVVSTQLFTMAPTLGPDDSLPKATRITAPPGVSLLAHWGALRVTS